MLLSCILGTLNFDFIFVISDTKNIILKYFKSTERFSDCFRVLIHGLMPTFREYCSSLHQDEKQPDIKFPMYIRCSVKKGRGGEGQGKGGGGKNRWNCDSSDFFFKVGQFLITGRMDFYILLML